MATPYFRFFPSDWLAGTRGLTLAERAIYLDLICLMYEAAEPIEENYRRLARIMGTTPTVTAKTITTLTTAGKLIREDGYLWNSRVEVEVKWRKTRTHLASSAGQKSSSLRAKKRKENNKPPSTNVLRDFNQPEPEPELERKNPPVIPPTKRGGTPCPEDFTPSKRSMELLFNDGYSLSVIEEASKEMVDWSIASDKRKVDWNATLRNWVRRNAKRAPPARRKSLGDTFSEMMEDGYFDGDREGDEGNGRARGGGNLIALPTAKR